MRSDVRVQCVHRPASVPGVRGRVVCAARRDGEGHDRHVDHGAARSHRVSARVRGEAVSGSKKGETAE